jgi:hypothetical protein
VTSRTSRAAPSRDGAAAGTIHHSKENSMGKGNNRDKREVKKPKKDKKK